MSRQASARATDFRQDILERYAVNDRMNQLLLELLDPRAWRAQFPGCKGRTIAAFFTHVHNIPGKWLRLSAPHLKLPPRLDRTRCTQQQAKQDFAQSSALCSRMLAEALAPQGRVKKFHRDGWFRPWSPGTAKFA